MGPQLRGSAPVRFRCANGTYYSLLDLKQICKLIPDLGKEAKNTILNSRKMSRMKKRFLLFEELQLE